MNDLHHFVKGTSVVELWRGCFICCGGTRLCEILLSQAGGALELVANFNGPGPKTTGTEQPAESLVKAEFLVFNQGPETLPEAH